MLTNEDSSMAANAIINEARIHYATMTEQLTAPSVVYRPKIYCDGGQWCALLGDDLQVGVAGFGKSPFDAMRDFDRNFYMEIK